MSLTVSIPNFNVHKVARNKYYVQAKDGQSALVSKSDLKKIAKANGGVVKVYTFDVLKPQTGDAVKIQKIVAE